MGIGARTRLSELYLTRGRIRSTANGAFFECVHKLLRRSVNTVSRVVSEHVLAALPRST